MNDQRTKEGGSHRLLGEREMEEEKVEKERRRK